MSSVPVAVKSGGGGGVGPDTAQFTFSGSSKGIRNMENFATYGASPVIITISNAFLKMFSEYSTDNTNWISTDTLPDDGSSTFGIGSIGGGGYFPNYVNCSGGLYLRN